MTGPIMPTGQVGEYSSFSEIPMEEVLLEVLTKHAQFSKHEIGPSSNYSAKMYTDEVRNAVIMCVKQLISGKPVRKVAVHVEEHRPGRDPIYNYQRWPKTWWQHFKDRWFPLWLQKFFPIKWDEFTVDIEGIDAVDIEINEMVDVEYNVCPHLPVHGRTSYGPHLRFMMMGGQEAKQESLAVRALRLLQKNIPPDLKRWVDNAISLAESQTDQKWEG